MASFMGINFAPMNVPMQRRLQTLAALVQFLLMVTGGPTGYVLIAYMICFTQYYWLALAYVCYILGERGVASRGSLPSDSVRHWIWWRYYRDYFPLKLVKTAELDPVNNYLLCAFPHGVLCSGVFANFATEANNVSELFPGIKQYTITLDQNFNSPFVREIILRLGMCSSSRESLNYLLDRATGTGRSIVLVVGGAAESLICKPGAYRVILKSRKGFVKLAMKNGACLVPVFSFGENDLYDQVANPEGGWVRWAQEVFRKVTGIAPVLMVGRGVFQYSFGVVPRRRLVTTVVGKPMAAVHILEPTQEQIDELHKKFEEQLVALFEENKHKYLENPEQTRLVIE